MSAPLLLVENLDVYYASSHILQGVSFTVRQGDITVLLGRNGVGKTTTLQSILGMPPPRRGTIRFQGESIAGLPTHTIIRRGISWVPQGHRIFPDLSVAENLMLAARKSRPGAWTLARIHAFFPWMAERGGASGGTLSGGEQQMLAIARALIQNPDLIFMDEPSEGLSPRIVEEIGQVILRLSDEGCSILMVEQNLGFALRVGREFLIMNKGRIVFRGDRARMDTDPDAYRQYLSVASTPHAGETA